MSDRSNPARIVIAVSSVVVAVCAVVVSVKVMTASPQPPLVNQTQMVKQVSENIRISQHSKGPVTDLYCPTAVVAKKGTTFTCDYGQHKVKVDITSDQGALYVHTENLDSL